MGAAFGCIFRCKDVSFTNQYHEKIYVKFDVQRPFIQTSELSAKGGAGFSGANIKFGGSKMEQNEWNKVKAEFTSIKPNHSFDRRRRMEGEVYLSVLSEDEEVKIIAWPVDANKSFIISKEGQLLDKEKEKQGKIAAQIDEEEKLESKRYEFRLFEHVVFSLVNNNNNNKTFDKVNHSKFIGKLHQYGIKLPVLEWYCDMEINPSMCQVMQVTGSRSKKPVNPNYCLHGLVLETATCAKCLGLTFLATCPGAPT